MQDRLAADLHQNKENESSSTSEQITLRPIGPGQGSFQSQSIQNNVNKQPSDTRFSQGHCGNQPLNIQSGKQVTHAQGPYRKIPRQETNFTNINPLSSEVTYVQGQPKQGPNGEFTWNFANKHLQSGFHGDKSNVQSNINSYQQYQPIPVTKSSVKGKSKRKSHSDDSLDELIESNIQYLESEMESGKLKKISASQPRMFPHQQSDIYNKIEKRRSSSLDSTKGLPINSFQNEMKLRLQIPSTKEPQFDNRSTQSSHYDRLSYSNSESSTPPSVYTLPPSDEYIFQNTAPKFERKFPSASQSPYMLRRTNNELSQMEDMSKSDSQLNFGEFGNDYSKKSNFPANFHAKYPPFPTQQGHGQDVMSVSASAVEGGMFSDVDYDIEVTDRIKRWEKFMKKKSTSTTSNESKSPVPLTTILESEGGIPETWTTKPQQPEPRSVKPENSETWSVKPQNPDPWSVKQQQSKPWSQKTQQSEMWSQNTQPNVTVSSISVTVTKSVAQQPQLQKQEVYMEPKVQSAETNVHRLFRVVNQPKIEQKSDAASFLAENLQKHAKIIRRSSSRDSDGGPSQGLTQPQVQGHSQGQIQGQTQSEVVEETSAKMWPPPSMTKNIDIENLKQARLSRFEEELTELQEIKSESVKDLRRRFDSDASGNESTEASTPMISTPLRQRRQFNFGNVAKPTVTQQPVKTEHISSITIQPSLAAPNKTQPTITQQKSDTADMWSPKLESGQGPVSIERVKARTLQTIPFHEDPIWKQIEEMTSFEDLVALQNMQNSESVNTNNQAFQFPPPSQPRSNQDVICSSYAPTIITTSRPLQTASTTEQQKPKVFHTPTIQPLKLAVAAKSSIEALDEVLDDIRLSLQKKKQNQQRNQPADSSASSSTVQSPVAPKNVVRHIPIEKLKQNNLKANVGQPVSQKYFDQQKNLLASQKKQPEDPRPGVRWVYPSKNVQQSHQVPNQTHPNQQSRQVNINLQTKQTGPDKFSWNNNQTYQGHSTKPIIGQSSQSLPNYYQSNQAHPNVNQQNPNLLFVQNNKQVPIDPDFTQFPYVINGNYQLDPSDLKERLMNTGLAFDAQSETDETMSQRSIASSFAETEKQFNQSIEDLQNLARDVEDKLSQIKCKIVDADENRLDSILSALRKFAPSEPVKTPPNIHTKEEQDRQRAKLNEALTELDRIYYGLHLDDPKMIEPRSKFDLMSQSQTLPSHHMEQMTSAPIRRNKSDSGFIHYQEATAAQVGNQTQQEFEDINKSFQTLLDEVSRDETDISSQPTHHATAIENTIESFLDEFRKSSDNTVGQKKNISEKFETKLQDAQKAAKTNTCRDIQKSEVFTVSSGNFSALVGVKNKKNESNFQKRSMEKAKQTNAVTKFRGPIKAASKGTSASEPKIISSTAKIKLVSPAREIKVIKTSGSESEDVSDYQMLREAKKSANLQHRKSMPACMLQRTVETQTQTAEPASPPVAVIRRKFQTNSYQSREGSVSSESSAESRRARRKTISKGIALLMEFFSSSEDERSGKAGLEHSTSAPDLRYVGCEKLTRSPSENEKLISKAKQIKQKHGSKSKKRSSYIKFDNIDDKIDDMSVTSTTSDDNVAGSHGSKPPRHPRRKTSATSPDQADDGNEIKSSPKQSNDSQSGSLKTEVKQDIVLRRKKSSEGVEERPHSFHELLATFEQNTSNLKKLRKCSSAEAMLQERTLMNKIFHSDPDLRKDSQFNNSNIAPAKLGLKVNVKETAL